MKLFMKLFVITILLTSFSMNYSIISASSTSGEEITIVADSVGDVAANGDLGYCH